MGIVQSLEEIRKKPEHIRIRYIFGCVFVSMIFILFLWIASLKQNFENIGDSATDKNPSLPADVQDTLKEIKKQSKNLQENLSETPLSPTPSDVESPPVNVGR